MLMYIDVSGRNIMLQNKKELSVALYLDATGKEWYYHDVSVPYIDMLTGKHNNYQIDFTVIDGDNVVWLEPCLTSKMIPTDARIYTSRTAEEAEIIYRGLSEDELAMAKWLLGIGYRNKYVLSKVKA